MDEPEPGVLEEGDDADNTEALARLARSTKRHRLRPKNRDGTDGQRVRDLITEAVLGPPKDTEEVDDDWFNVRPEKARISVKVLAAAGTIKRKLGAGGSRRQPESDADLSGRSQNAGSGAPLVVVHEDDEREASARLGAAGVGGPSLAGPAPAPFYSKQSFFESPNNSAESLVSYLSPTQTTTSDSRPPTPSAGPTTPRPASPLPPRPGPSSRASVPSEDDPLLANAPSRTLTIDEHLNAPGRRKRHRHRPTSSRAAELARRAHRAFRGDATMTDMGDALEDELAQAGFIGVEKEQYEVDILWENQRGLVVFGEPKFAANALFAVDPAPWANSHLRNSPYTPHDHPLPTPAWKWDHDQWMVDMGRDTDENGWSYAWRFRSSHWRGEAEGWRSFVRRRRWIRGRYYHPPPLLLLKGIKDADDTGIDWNELLRNSEFADATTPDDGPAIDADELPVDDLSANYRPPSRLSSSRSSVTGFKTATALLPVSHDIKSDVWAWDVALDAHDPFLPWSFIEAQGELVLARRREQFPAGSRSDDELVGLWRESVVEINYHRVARVLRQCRVDREKLGMLRWYLGEPASPRLDREREFFDEFSGDPDACGTMAADVVRALGPNSVPAVGIDARSWDADDKRPAPEDVWDLLEARLDHVLNLFEFQHSRLHLLRLVLSLHPVAHAHHRYRGYDGDEPFEPGVLSPKLLGSRLRRRMDFYTDVVELQKFFAGSVERDAKGKARETSAA